MASSDLFMESHNSVESYNFTWKIHNFSKCRDVVQSPTFSPSEFVSLQIFLEIKFILLKNNQSSVMQFYLRKYVGENIPQTMRIRTQLEFNPSIKFDSMEIPHAEILLATDETVLIDQVTSGLNYIDRCDAFISSEILTITCKLELFGHRMTTRSDGGLQRIYHPKIFNFKNLYDSKTFSDLTFIVDQKKFEVHRAILAARSPVFKTMLSNHWKESTSGCVSITDVDSDAFEVFLKYLYTADVSDKSLMTSIGVFELASKYGVSDLKDVCSDIIAASLNIETTCRILLLAYLHSDQALKEKTVKFTAFHFADIRFQPDWKSIVKDYPDLASEVFGFITSKFSNVK